jgi:hypothetical protein
MISRTQRRPGRPKDSTRIRAEDCAAIRASPRLTRPGRPLAWTPRSRVAHLTVTWAGGRPTSLSVALLSTAQRLGGFRRWFACPSCGRRAGCLYSPSEGQSFACRVCWGLVYRSQYLPYELRLLVSWFNRMGSAYRALIARRRAARWNEPHSTAASRRPTG